MGLLPHDLILLGLYVIMLVSGLTGMGASYLPSSPRNNLIVIGCLVAALCSCGGILYTLLTPHG